MQILIDVDIRIRYAKEKVVGKGTHAHYNKKHNKKIN
jgi:hypothetical protein